MSRTTSAARLVDERRAFSGLDAGCRRLNPNWPMHRRDILRYVLSGLLAFVGVSAVGGGIFGIVGAQGVPTEWLRGTPFDSYFLPSLILLLGVGGSSLVAAGALFRGHRFGRQAAFAAGTILLLWMAVQLSMIGYASWLQPLFLAAAVLILVLAGALPRSRCDDASGESDRAKQSR